MNIPRSLSVLVALVVAVSVFVAITINISDAQGHSDCPPGSVLHSDGVTCVSDSDDGVNANVTTTRTCLQGVLSDDGQFCITPRIDGGSSVAGTDGPGSVPVPNFTG